MVKHILVAADGSTPSRNAAAYAFELARQMHAKVTLLTVLPQPEVMPLGPLSGFATVTPSLTTDDLRVLKVHLAELADASDGVEYERVVEIGPVVDTIVRWAAQHAVDMIVIGARGLGAGQRLLLGSISDRVVHGAHCPVTVWR